MPRSLRHHKKHATRNRIAQMTKDGLFLLILFLIAIILMLILGVGDFLLPAGMVAYRNQIAGVLSFIVFILILLFPIIVEFNSHPRHLSGPGKNPEQGGRP